MFPVASRQSDSGGPSAVADDIVLPWLLLPVWNGDGSLRRKGGSRVK